MTGLVSYALTSGGIPAAFTAFLIAALVMALLMIGTSIAVSLAKKQLVDQLKIRVREVKRWGGYLLILIGLWLIILGVWANFFALIFPV